MKVQWIKIKNPDDMQFFAGKIYPKDDADYQYIEDEFGTQYSVSPDGLKELQNFGWEIEVQYESIH
ncbi:hypothetical protein FDG95_gp542 [Pectobacterium phage vB_PcaM_CBB]|uniref:Uncharacterized protein n=1 Tax=Pectobacterium phage vB_PcaM_CBB TaxID=2772511 RepID=A0A1L2CVD7_9CAUD|nr:hypothetical protein FDG95_gp542 [Pectobacterium phage vB_PcaM_CBB]AMM44000.1 hypothetical protein CBB_437 [Pectobacterium phage vB_PcaM_CBB]